MRRVRRVRRVKRVRRVRRVRKARRASCGLLKGVARKRASRRRERLSSTELSAL